MCRNPMRSAEQFYFSAGEGETKAQQEQSLVCGLRVGVFCPMTWRQKTRAHPLVKSCGFPPGTVFSGQLGASEGASTVAADAGTLAAPASGASLCPCPSCGCCSSSLLAPGWEQAAAMQGSGFIDPDVPLGAFPRKGEARGRRRAHEAGTGCSAPLRHGAAAGCAAGVPLLLFPPLSTPLDVAGQAVPCWEKVLLGKKKNGCVFFLKKKKHLRRFGCSGKGSELPEHLDNVVTYAPSQLPCTGQGISLCPLQGSGNQGRGKGEARSHTGRWAHGCPGLRATEALRWG